MTPRKKHALYKVYIMYSIHELNTYMLGISKRVTTKNQLTISFVDDAYRKEEGEETFTYNTYFFYT